MFTTLTTLLRSHLTPPPVTVPCGVASPGQPRLQRLVRAGDGRDVLGVGAGLAAASTPGRLRRVVLLQSAGEC